MIAVIDYGSGNLRSVSKALEKLGASVVVTSDKDVVLQADKVILPGVGAFGDAMCELRKRNLISPIKKVIQNNKPFLGICIGLQVLFSSSDENPDIPGLNIFKGKIARFQNRDLKVPHMGWNSIVPNEGQSGIFKDTKKDTYFYFVHSFYAIPEDPSIVVGKASYGVDFPAIIEKENVWATQFHPEKSQSEGLKILENFINY